VAIRPDELNAAISKQLWETGVVSARPDNIPTGVRKLGCYRTTRHAADSQDDGAHPVSLPPCRAEN
jgi:hypothetical protein